MRRRLRSGSCFPEWLLEHRRRAEQALVSVVATSYLLGVSTRRVDKLVEQMGLKGISKSQVSEMSKVLDAQVVASLEAKHPDAAEHLDAAREDLLAFTGFPNLKAERPDWLEREQAVQAEVRRRNSASSSSASSPDSRDASGRAHRRSQGRPRIKAGKRRSPGPDRHRSGHASTADSTDGYFLIRGALAAGDGTHQV